MDVVIIDANDTSAFGDWFGPLRASDVDAWPEDPGWAEAEIGAFVRRQEGFEWVLGAARDARGHAVGALRVRMPTTDNLRVATLGVDVHPGHRGQGVGRALLQCGERIATERGRTVLLARTEGHGAPERSRDAAFARAAGYTAALTNVRRDLRLPMEGARLVELESACAPHAAGYEIVTWLGACPDELVAGRARLAQVISTDAPHGALEMEGELWDDERVRNWEQTVADMGRELACAGAIEVATDELVGFSDAGLPRHGEDLAYQFDTVVSPGHRGHRLGLLVKIANLRSVLEQAPTTRRICTWNALGNDPMIRLNELLGFEVVGGAIEWQKALG